MKTQNPGRCVVLDAGGVTLGNTSTMMAKYIKILSRTWEMRLQTFPIKSDNESANVVAKASGKGHKIHKVMAVQVARIRPKSSIPWTQKSGMILL